MLLGLGSRGRLHGARARLGVVLSRLGNGAEGSLCEGLAALAGLGVVFSWLGDGTEWGLGGCGPAGGRVLSHGQDGAEEEDGSE